MGLFEAFSKYLMPLNQQRVSVDLLYQGRNGFENQRTDLWLSQFHV